MLTSDIKRLNLKVVNNLDLKVTFIFYYYHDLNYKLCNSVLQRNTDY